MKHTAFDWAQTNHHLSAKHAIDRKTIARMRKSANAPPSPGRKAALAGWDKSLTDVDNARRLNVSVHTIIRYRQSLGLAPVRDPSPPVDWENVNWDRDDADLARDLKCHVTTVWKMRKKTIGPRPKASRMKVDSMKMSAENWAALLEVAAATKSLYSGLPSWRRLMLRIARGEVRCSEAPKSKRRPKE